MFALTVFDKKDFVLVYLKKKGNCDRSCPLFSLYQERKFVLGPWIKALINSVSRTFLRLQCTNRDIPVTFHRNSSDVTVKWWAKDKTQSIFSMKMEKILLFCFAYNGQIFFLPNLSQSKMLWPLACNISTTNCYLFVVYMSINCCLHLCFQEADFFTTIGRIQLSVFLTNSLTR